MDTPLMWTPNDRQFALSLGKESPYIFSKFNPLNMDTPLIRTPNYDRQFALSLGKESPHFT